MSDAGALDDDSLDSIAGQLRESMLTRVPIDPLSETYPGLGLRDAYDVQQRQATMRLAGGARLIGHKVGLTSAPMRRALGVDVPDFGHLFDDMVLVEGEPIHADAFIAPRVEPEFAFVLERPLHGPVTYADVVRAISFAVPAIELIDSRIRDWRIGLVDTVADNGSSGALLLGSRPFDVRQLDLRLLGCLLSLDGTVVESGAGGAVLGHPVTSVVWLVNALAEYGIGLEPGHIVMSGSITAPIYVHPGSHVLVEFSGLGSLELSFS